MALNAGDPDTPGSMSKAIYDGLVGAFGSVVGSDDTKRREFCNVIASAVVGHIAAHADVRITTANSGIQRADVNNVPNTATLAPAADVVLLGAVE